ncbi:hypothetical protein [Alcanivorax sp.]|uniref:hypothetical protein n=1 Tax=Alcanivorax sp. TaxID=1872427 RepID=UPI000C0CEA51|nr:hypothetical protein [Alcanivorax sp.]PHR65560.1 MAG: hypothetical protein COA55_11010 [Alcanivorax sp.]
MFNKISGAKVSTDIKISAKRSQSAPLILIVISGISLIVAFVFLWYQPTKSWIGFIFCIIFGATGSFLWWHSHRNSEFDSGTPTTITDGKSGLSVTADPRLIDNKNAAEMLASLITTIAYRKPLPEPDGLVDSNGNPDPSQKNKAEDIVHQANQQAEHAAKQFQQTKTTNQSVSADNIPTKDSYMSAKNLPLGED